MGMNDTTSFLGGAAVAGLAALVLLKGVGSNSTANMLPQVQQPLPISTVQAPLAAPLQVPPTPVPQQPSVSLDQQLGQQLGEQKYEQMKMLFEQQKAETERLRAQVQSQQATIETMQRASVTHPPRMAQPQLAPSQAQPLDTSNAMFNGMLWALGGVALSLGGGIVLVTMFVLVAKQQRSGARVDLIPSDEYGYFPERRYVQALPPRRAPRRIKVMDEV